jgi:hypothetical protein
MADLIVLGAHESHREGRLIAVGLVEPPFGFWEAAKSSQSQRNSAALRDTPIIRRKKARKRQRKEQGQNKLLEERKQGRDKERKRGKINY